MYVLLFSIFPFFLLSHFRLQQNNTRLLEKTLHKFIINLTTEIIPWQDTEQSTKLFFRVQKEIGKLKILKKIIRNIIM